MKSTVNTGLLTVACMFLSCTNEGETLAVTVISGEVAKVEWSGDPARDLRLFRCDSECPAAQALPAYGKESDPRPVGTSLVWHLYGLNGVEAGMGSIPAPISVGTTPDGVEEIVPFAATSLKPGSYVVRVVQSKGNLLSATWATGWGQFTQP